MANPERDQELELLRHKYAHLTQKYRQLVERVERDRLQHTAIFQLGAWGLQHTALLLVRHGSIVFAGERFTAFAGVGKGRFVEDATGSVYEDVRAGIVALARRAEAAESRYQQSSLRHEARDLVFAVRAEALKGREASYVAVVVEDVTEQARRERELIRTREALLQRERLRVLGELAAAVAHDLANTLRGASFEISALGDRFDGALAGIARRVEIASAIVGQLHDFARRGTMTTDTVNLRDIIDQAVALAEIELREGSPAVTVERHIPEMPLVRGSAAELSLLFVNLLRNARDAMAEGGTVAISAKPDGPSITVFVEDDGAGIPEEILPRLFQPFFTTKGRGGGGLGLWLARSCMERLGGTISAANRRGGGASFSLVFPVAEAVSRPRRDRSRGQASAEQPLPAKPPRQRVRRKSGPT